MNMLSSYIQFIAAVYLTMSIDQLFGRYFWSVYHYKSINGLLRSAKVPSVNQKEILDVAKSAEEQEVKQSRKRGTYWLLICLLLLIYTGFETPMILSADIYSFYIVVPIAFLIYAFGKYILNQWKKVYAVVCGLVILFFILKWIFIKYVSSYASLHVESTARELIYFKWAIIIAISLPIIVQMLRNWLYSHLYLKYVESHIYKCMNEYNAARAFKTGDEISEIAAIYHNAVNHKVSKFKKEDEFIRDVSVIVSQEITKETKMPSLFMLIGTYFSRDKIKLVQLNEIDYSEMLSESVGGSKEKRLTESELYEAYYQEYIHIKPIPKLEKFCKEKGIDYQKFKKFFSQAGGIKK